MESLGIAAALLSAASWAFGTVVFERLGRVIPYAGLTFLKGTLSVALMLLLVLTVGSLGAVSTADAAILVASGIVGIALGDTLFFKSLQDLGAKVQVVFFMLGQVVTIALSQLLLGEVLCWGGYVGGGILLCGVAVVTWGKQENHPNKLRGIIGGLGGVMCFSVSTVMIKYADAEIDAVTATFYRMTAGTLAMTLAGAATHRLREWLAPLRQPGTLLLFLLNVCVITIGGFVLSMYAIRTISVSLASMLSATEPVFVLPLALVLSHERISRRELIGAAVSVAGLIIIIAYG